MIRCMAAGTIFVSREDRGRAMDFVDGVRDRLAAGDRMIDLGKETVRCGTLLPGDWIWVHAVL